MVNKLSYMNLSNAPNLVEKYMIVMLIIVSLVALFLPKTFIWLPLDLITYFLIIIMFSMGLTLKTSDFDFIIKCPKDLLIGFLSQFLIMPTLAFIIGLSFNLETALFAGLIIVGTCPGGTSSPDAASIFSTGIVILVSVILLNLGGYLFGFLLERASGMSIRKSKAISIETGM